MSGAEDLETTLARLAAEAGAKVSALEDIGTDFAKLTTSVDNLAAAISSMATKEEVAEAAEEQDRRRRRSLLAVGAALVLLAVSATVNFIVLVRLADVADANRRSGQVLLECTTPSPGPGKGVDAADDVHECYDRQQAATAAVVGRLTLAMLDAAVCARTEPSPQAIRACYADAAAASSALTEGGP